MRVLKTTQFYIAHYFRQQGPLRLLLMLFAVLLMVLMPSAGTPLIYQGSDIFFTVLPVILAPLVATVLLFDALMSRVLMSDAMQYERTRHRLIIHSNLVLAAIVFAVWLPYFFSLGQTSS
jgi:hypothetical protein